jgi:hypothetical protein
MFRPMPTNREQLYLPVRSPAHNPIAAYDSANGQSADALAVQLCRLRMHGRMPPGRERTQHGSPPSPPCPIPKTMK